jgi:hypothetical protein
LSVCLSVCLFVCLFCLSVFPHFYRPSSWRSAWWTHGSSIANT